MFIGHVIGVEKLVIERHVDCIVRIDCRLFRAMMPMMILRGREKIFERAQRDIDVGVHIYGLERGKRYINTV